MADIFGFGAPTGPPDIYGFGGSSPAPDLSARQRSLQTILSLTPQNQRQQLLDAYSKDPELAQVTQGYNVNAPVQGQYGNDLGTQAYQLGSGLIQGGLDLFVPNQSAGGDENVIRNQQGQATGQFNTPTGHAASTMDVARQGVADKFFLNGVPGLAGAGAGTEVGANVLQRGLTKGIQMAPGFMAGNAVQSFNGDGSQITPGQQFEKTLGATDMGAAQSLGFGVGGELLGAAGGLAAKGIGKAADGIQMGVNKVGQAFQDSPEVQARTQALINQGVPAGHAQMLAQGGQEGTLSGTGPDLTTPKGINDHINYIQQQLDAMPAKMREMQTRIQNTPDIPSNRKPVLLKQAGDDMNAEANALKEEMAAHIQTLNGMGMNHIPDASIPQGVPETPTQPKGAAYAGPNSYVINPTLKQKIAGVAKQVAEPFMNNDPNRPTSVMGLLKSESGNSGLPIINGSTKMGEAPKPIGEQIGRLKAQIAKEPDPNVKVELTNQLKGLNKQFSAEKSKDPFRQDGEAWQDYNARYDRGVGTDTAKTKQEFEGYLNGDPKIFARSRDGLMLKDAINGDKRVAHPDNPAFNKQFEAEARKAGLVVDHFPNGDPVVGKNAADVKAWINKDYKGKAGEHALIGYKSDRFQAKSSSDVIADTLGLKPEERVPTKEPVTKPETGDVPIKEAKASEKATAEAIKNQRNAPAPYDGFKDVKSWQDVRDNGATGGNLTRNNVKDIKAQVDATFGKKKSADRVFRFFDSIEHPESLVKNAKALKVTPEQLKEKIDAFKNATEFQHSLRSGTGEAVGHLDRYALHPWDRSDPAAAKALDEIIESKGGVSKGAAGKQRVFPTLREGLRTQYTDANGILQNFKLKNQSIGDAIADWGHEETRAVQAGALKQAILHKDPQGFKDFSSTQPHTPEGAPYKVSGVPGLSGWMSPEVYHQTQGFRIINTDALGKPLATLLSVIDKTNRLGKGIELLGGAFHDINTSGRYIAQELASSFTSLPNNPLRGLHAIGHSIDMTRAFWDHGYHDRLEMQWQKQGWNDLFAKTHLTTTQASDATAFEKLKGANIEGINPYSQALFDRKIATMKKATMIEEAKSMGIKDPRKATPQQIARLSGASDAVNARFGGINLQTVNRNPIVQYILRQFGLAPDFMEGKLRTWAYTAGNFDPRRVGAVNQALPEKFQKGNGGEFQNDIAHGQSSLALRQFIGTTLLIGTIAELSRQAMGIGSNKNPDGSPASPQDTAKNVWNNDVKDPSVALPFKNKNGQRVVGKLPSTDVSELTRAFMDPGHYVTARASAGVSLATEIGTGKDYFGKPLVDPNTNPNPTFTDTLGAALKSKASIPGVQGMNVANNKSTVPEALTNIAGLRVVRDPTDPAYIDQKKYFDTLKQVTHTMTANQLNEFNVLNPTKKDYNGDYLPDSTFNPFNSPEHQAQLLKSLNGDGVVLNATIAAQTASAQHDPLWDLSNTDKTAVGPNGEPVTPLAEALYHEFHASTDPGGAQEKEDLKNNPWITDLNTARGAFFNSLPPSKNPNGANPIAYPTIDPATQDLMNQETQITDPAQKSAFINAHPELSTAYQQIADYTDGRRAQIGDTKFAQAPVASAQVQAMMNAGNFKDPQVQQYLNATAAFKIAGPFGDGIGGGGGGRNTPASAIANVSQGLQANGKPSPYAQNSARNKAASLTRSLKNNIKYANKAARADLRKNQSGHGAHLALTPQFKPQPKAKGLAAALKGVGRKA